jgi:hypothetical protein
MIAKIATFRVKGPRPVVRSAGALTHSNDNKINARTGACLHRTRRPVLACHWRPIHGGGLECHWEIELSGGVASTEPDQRWMNSRLCRLFIGTGGGRLALPALG